MANTKISALTAGGAALSTDLIPAARSGNDVAITAAAIAALAAAGAVTSVAGRTGAVVLAETDITNLTTDIAATVLTAPTAYSASASVAASVKYGQATAGSGGITLTLQSSLLSVGQKQRFMKMDSAVGSVTFTDASGKTFCGLGGWAQTSWELVNQGQYADFVWDGTQYTVFGN